MLCSISWRRRVPWQAVLNLHSQSSWRDPWLNCQHRCSQTHNSPTLTARTLTSSHAPNAVSVYTDVSGFSYHHYNMNHFFLHGVFVVQLAMELVVRLMVKGWIGSVRDASLELRGLTAVSVCWGAELSSQPMVGSGHTSLVLWPSLKWAWGIPSENSQLWQRLSPEPPGKWYTDVKVDRMWSLVISTSDLWYV